MSIAFRIFFLCAIALLYGVQQKELIDGKKEIIFACKKHL